MIQRTCKSCHASIIGRRDKKFCSAKCRSAFNNEQYRNENRDVLELEKLKKLTRNQVRDVYKIFGDDSIPDYLIHNSKIDIRYNTGDTKFGDLIFLDFELCRSSPNTYQITKLESYIS